MSLAFVVVTVGCSPESPRVPAARLAVERPLRTVQIPLVSSGEIAGTEPHATLLVDDECVFECAVEEGLLEATGRPVNFILTNAETNAGAGVGFVYVEEGRGVAQCRSSPMHLREAGSFRLALVLITKDRQTRELQLGLIVVDRAK